MLTGPGGSLASGRFSTLVYVPAPGPLPWLGAGAALGWSRALRRRIRSRTAPSAQPEAPDLRKA